MRRDGVTEMKGDYPLEKMEVQRKLQSAFGLLDIWHFRLRMVLDEISYTMQIQNFLQLKIMEF